MIQTGSRLYIGFLLRSDIMQNEFRNDKSTLILKTVVTLTLR